VTNGVFRRRRKASFTYTSDNSEKGVEID
jgi:hypothetical protein